MKLSRDETGSRARVAGPAPRESVGGKKKSRKAGEKDPFSTPEVLRWSRERERERERGKKWERIN